MHLSWGLIADAVVAGAQGKKNIIGTFTTIYSPIFPAKHPSLALAFRIEGSQQEQGKHHFELVFVDADYKNVGKPIKAAFDLAPQNIPAVGLPLAFEVILQFQDLVLPSDGSYEFAIRVDGRHIGSIPLYAVKVTPPSA